MLVADFVSLLLGFAVVHALAVFVALFFRDQLAAIDPLLLFGLGLDFVLM